MHSASARKIPPAGRCAHLSRGWVPGMSLWDATRCGRSWACRAEVLTACTASEPSFGPHLRRTFHHAWSPGDRAVGKTTSKTPGRAWTPVEGTSTSRLQMLLCEGTRMLFERVDENERARAGATRAPRGPVVPLGIAVRRYAHIFDLRHLATGRWFRPPACLPKPPLFLYFCTSVVWV